MNRMFFLVGFLALGAAWSLATEVWALRASLSDAEIRVKNVTANAHMGSLRVQSGQAVNQLSSRIDPAHVTGYWVWYCDPSCTAVIGPAAVKAADAAKGRVK